MGNNQSVNEIHFRSESRNMKNYVPSHTIVHEPIREPIHHPIKRQPSYAQPENRVLPDVSEVKLRPVARSMSDMRVASDYHSSHNSRASSHGSQDSKRPLSVIDARTFNKIYDSHEENGYPGAHVYRSPSSMSTPQKSHHKHRAPPPPSKSVPATPNNRRTGKLHKPSFLRNKKKAPEPPKTAKHNERLYRKNNAPVISANASPKRNRKNRKAPLPPSTNMHRASSEGTLVCRIEPSVRPPTEPPIDYNEPPLAKIPPAPAPPPLPDNSVSNEITLTAVVHNSENAGTSNSNAATGEEKRGGEKIDVAMKRLSEAITSIRQAAESRNNVKKNDADSVPKLLSRQESVSSGTKDTVSEKSDSNEDSEKVVVRRLSSLLQHDIVRAANARPSMPCVIKQDYDKPKSFQQLFEDELSLAYTDREKRRSSGNMRQKPAQEPMRFSAKHGRAVPRSELKARREKSDDKASESVPSELDERQYIDSEDEREAAEAVDAKEKRVSRNSLSDYPAGASNLRSLFARRASQSSMKSSTQNQLEDEDDDAIHFDGGEDGLMETKGSYKKKKIDKSKFNSIKRIKKSVKNAIGSLGRASARIQAKLHSEQLQQEPDRPAVLHTDHNWSVAPGVQSRRRDYNDENGTPWGIVDINIDDDVDYERVVNGENDEKEIEPRQSSEEVKRPKGEKVGVEEGIACYDNKGKVVVIPQCEVVKIVKKHTGSSRNTSENGDDNKDDGETKRFVYQPTKVGQDKMEDTQEWVNNSMKAPNSRRSSVGSAGVKSGALPDELKENYVLVPRDHLEKLMKTNERGQEEGKGDVTKTPRKSSKSDVESEHGNTLGKKKNKKKWTIGRSKKGKKKYVVVDDSDESDEEEVVKVRKNQSMMMAPPPGGYYGSQHMYQPPPPQGPYPMMHATGFHPGMMTDYAQQMQMASYQASIHQMHAGPGHAAMGYHGNHPMYPPPGNMMHPYGSMPFNAAFMNHAYQPDQLARQPQPGAAVINVVASQSESGDNHDQSSPPDTKPKAATEEKIENAPQILDNVEDTPIEVENTEKAPPQNIEKVVKSESSSTVDSGFEKEQQPVPSPEKELELVQEEEKLMEPAMPDLGKIFMEVGSAKPSGVVDESAAEEGDTVPDLRRNDEKRASFLALMAPRGYRPMNINLPQENSGEETTSTHM